MVVSTPEETPELASDHVIAAAPRLAKIAAATAISFGLWDGANRALFDQENTSDDVRQCAAGYRSDSILMTVVRLALLFDRCPTSFQSVYRCLNRPEVVAILIRRKRSESLLAEAMGDQIEERIQDCVARYLSTYLAIDWDGLHGRLKDFRNRGVAHLTPDGIGKRVTYEEIQRLVHVAVSLRECLMPFVPDAAAFHDDEVEEWSNRALAIWRASFRNRDAA